MHLVATLHEYKKANTLSAMVEIIGYREKSGTPGKAGGLIL
jgi:hypothetical protein